MGNFQNITIFWKYFNENSPIIDSSSHLSCIYSKILKKYDLENSKVLDYGCGNSTYKTFFKNSEYIGYDLEPDKNNTKLLKLNSYDFILANFVLEHVANPLSA